MEIRFNLEKEARRAFVGAIGEITGEAAVYQGAPSFAFKVGGYTVDRCGTLSRDGLPEALPMLLDELAARGYVYEGQENGVPVPDGGEMPDGGDLGDVETVTAEGGESVETTINSDREEAAVTVEAIVTAVASDEGRLAIEIPLSDLAPLAVANLERLIAAKAWVFKKMAGAEELPIKRSETELSFPWFRSDAAAAEIDAYSCLIARLCETAKTKKRAAATERLPEPGDNEKFKARCALLALGFIGAEYAEARKILLAPFGGNGSHKTGNGSKS